MTDGFDTRTPKHPHSHQMTAMMEQMLRDPNMQKMLYPYLPEPMRNPQSIEWMLNTPEVRKQLEQTLASSVSPRGRGGAGVA